MTAVGRLLMAPDTRVVTLTGPPGVGKTRLAIAAAAAAAPRFADGVAFVDLTDVRDPALVARGGAGRGRRATRAAGGRPTSSPGADRGEHAPRLIDNFEHVLDAGPVDGRARWPGARACGCW